MPKEDIAEKDFIDILEEIKTSLLKTGLKSINSGEEFEDLVFDYTRGLCEEKGIVRFGKTGKHSFPDLYIGSYGIEVKFTIGDSWITTGNSVTEATRKSGLKKIYVFFGKRGNNGMPDIKFRPYEECVFDIAVTHSPRYKINVELPKEANIFAKMKTDYEAFCKNDPIKLVKNYYRSTLKKGEELWWLDTETAPVIKNFRTLDKDSQKNFMAEAMILYPEVFSRSQLKYKRPTLYLLTRYQAQYSSFRDIFTAAGQKLITLLDGKSIRVRKILYHLYDNAKEIKDFLTKSDRDELANAWGVKIRKSDDIEEIWLHLINKQTASKKIKASLIYKAGLRER